MATHNTYIFNESKSITKGAFELYGYSFKCTEDAELVLRDGDDATADGVIYIYLLTGQSIRDCFERGISFARGMYVDLVSGQVRGSIWEKR